MYSNVLMWLGTTYKNTVSPQRVTLATITFIYFFICTIPDLAKSMLNDPLNSPLYLKT